MPLPAVAGAKAKARVEAIQGLSPEVIKWHLDRQDQFAAEETSRKRQQRWDALCKARGERYASCRLSNYEVTSDKQRHVLNCLTDYRDNMQEYIKASRGIVLFGPVGTGKDHLLMALAGAAIVTEGLSVRWQNGMDWFGDVRDSFDSQVTERDLVLSLSYPDILMLSDPLPPIGNLSSFQANMLLRVIDRRYSMGKPTWVTVNCESDKEAVKRMGIQIVDRLSHDAVALFCDWESYRTK